MMVDWLRHGLGDRSDLLQPACPVKHPYYENGQETNQKSADREGLQQEVVKGSHHHHCFAALLALQLGICHC